MGKWPVWTVLAFLALSIYSSPLGAQLPVDGPMYRLVAQAPAATATTGDALSKAVKEAGDRVSNPRAGDAVLDLSVPKSPAFTALGVTPENLVRPTTPKQLATSLLSGADPRGNIQTGLALETAPYLLIGGNEVTLKDYIGSRPIQIASRTQFSLATAKGTSDDDKSTRVALGFLIVPIDLGDPRLDEKLRACFTEKLAPINKDADEMLVELAPIAATKPLELPQKIAEAQERFSERARHAIEPCREEARTRLWNASAWHIGVAPTWTSPDGNTSDLRWSGASVWTSLSYGFEKIPVLDDTAQILLHGRYRPDELAPDPQRSGSFLRQDTLTLAVQLRIVGFSFRKTTGGPDLNFLFEAAYVREDRRNRRDEKVFRYTAGFDYKLTTDLYLDVSLGTEDGRQDSRDGKFAMVGLKWAFSDKPIRTVK